MNSASLTWTMHSEIIFSLLQVPCMSDGENLGVVGVQTESFIQVGVY